MAWETSTRRARLPKDWPKRVAATKARAKGRCEGVTLAGESPWHAADCDGFGRECDHHERGDDHALSNLRWLSTPCHKAKTEAENVADRARLRRRSEAHPGQIGH